MKNPDEIMAEYLLKGGKMLSTICQTCGSPLFEYKGETICVVCSEQRKDKKTETPGELPKEHGSGETQETAAIRPETATKRSLSDELEQTLVHLCRMARETTRPDECLALMEAIHEGMKALKNSRK
jgi:UPF0148 protein